MRQSMSTLVLAALCGLACAGKSDTGIPFVEVFTPGEGDYPCIRIPAIARIPTSGRLVAFAECRRVVGDGCNPTNATTPTAGARRDLCMKYSDDQGKTWSALDVIVKGAMQPVPVWSTVKKALVLAYNICATCPQAYLNYQITSADGVHWSVPVAVNTSPDTAAVGPGSGAGIELWVGANAGKLAFIGHNGYYTYDSVWVSSSTENLDDYKTCTNCKTALEGQNEAVLVQLPSGTVVANMRNEHDTACKCRGVAYSHDGGLTFSHRTFDPTLIDPINQATLQFLPSVQRVAFANSASTTSRTHGTVRLGHEVHNNGTIEWTTSVLVNEGGYGYSSLVDVDRAGVVGLLWESSGPQCKPDSGVSCRTLFSLVDYDTTEI